VSPESARITVRDASERYTAQTSAPLEMTGLELVGLLDEGGFPTDHPDPNATPALFDLSSGRALELDRTLRDEGVVDGATIVFGHVQIAGVGPVEAAAALGTLKLSLDAARVAVEAYRAKTERLALELERDQLVRPSENPPSA
jgi:hypothetical protein